MKTGWKREESSIAAVCGGRLAGTQERVTQPTSDSGSGEDGEQREEEEEAGDTDHRGARGGPGSGSGGRASIINKALVRITGATWADPCVSSGRLGGHLVSEFLFTQV